VRTAARLATLGHEVLVDPLLDLRFAPPARLVGDALPDGIILTSANGARAVEGHPDLAALKKLPLWTVGARTTEAARALGFAAPRGEAPDAVSLGALLRAEPAQTFLYLAAEQRSGDFSVLAPEHRVDVRVVYSAVPKTELNPATAAALGDGGIVCVLHYSRRLAETYLALAAAAGIRKAALAPAQLCLSEQVASPLRAAGAPAIRVAAEPREDALIALLAG
jgi:uroporphyrinogen-III synthase